MLRSATKQTRRALSRVRTNRRVAQSVRHQSAGGTEGALLVTPTPAIVGYVVGIGGGLASVSNYYEMKQAEQRLAEAEARHRFDNTMRMFNEWFGMASSREAVLHKRYNSDGHFNLHKLIAMGNQSKVHQTKPAPASVANVMGFFLLWQSLEKSGTINSADLKERIGSQLATFHDILTEIRDEEAKSWDKADSDRLDSVVDFLDEVSKRETEG